MILKISSENAKFNEEKAKIEGLTNLRKQQMAFLQEHENGGFPFHPLCGILNYTGPIPYPSFLLIQGIAL